MAQAAEAGDVQDVVALADSTYMDGGGWAAERVASSSATGPSELMLLGLESLGEGVGVFDADHVLAYANAALAAQHGVRARDLIGRHMRSFLPIPSEVSDAQIMDMIAASGILRLEVEGQQDGSPNVQVTASLMYDDYGHRVGHVVCVQNITERKLHESALSRSALHDSLTGLPNRRHLLDALEKAVRDEGSIALLFIDLDEFKSINDSHGHAAGDEILRTAARRMIACVRDTDLLARIGGDEFVILLRDVHDSDIPMITAHRILAALREPTDLAAGQITVSASIGIATSSTGTARDLLHRADTAMYEAKTAGRGQIVTAGP